MNKDAQGHDWKKELQNI